MKNNRSYIATPPGFTIKEQLENRGMSQKEFASRIGMSERYVSQLVNGEVQLTPDVANQLEAVLEVPARFWSNLEAIYRNKLAKQESEAHTEKVFCMECREDRLFTVKEVDVCVKGKQYIQKQAFCKKCGCEVYDSKIWDKNIERYTALLKKTKC